MCCSKPCFLGLLPQSGFLAVCSAGARRRRHRARPRTHARMLSLCLCETSPLAFVCLWFAVSVSVSCMPVATCTPHTDSHCFTCRTTSAACTRCPVSAKFFKSQRARMPSFSTCKNCVTCQLRRLPPPLLLALALALWPRIRPKQPIAQARATPLPQPQERSPRRVTVSAKARNRRSCRRWGKCSMSCSLRSSTPNASSKSVSLVWMAFVGSLLPFLHRWLALGRLVSVVCPSDLCAGQHASYARVSDHHEPLCFSFSTSPRYGV